MTLEQEFEVRKTLHLFNTVQVYLAHKYFVEVEKEAIVPPQVLQTAIAEQVVNDLEGIICEGKLKETYEKANSYLISHNLDIDELITIN